MRTIFSVIVLLGHHIAYGQTIGWYLKDLKKDSLFGINLPAAYAELLNNKKSTSVIVAVIDNGIDTSHEDVKGSLWLNSKDYPNGKDDDKNGYADDYYGWNFIGGPSGNVEYDNLEMVRLIRRDKNFYDSLALSSVAPSTYKQSYSAYRKMLNLYYERFNTMVTAADDWEKRKALVDKIVGNARHDDVSTAEFENYAATSDFERQMKQVILNEFQLGNNFVTIYHKIDSVYRLAKKYVDYQLNIDYDPRSIIGDNYANPAEKFYGNNNVYGFHPDHGTHVTGIIAASRNNQTGIDGIADNVRIMSIRVVPEGDERDKDVANAIRYAVDNGSKIINMSFGKPFSWDKTIVDVAVKYAMKKDVLIVHAAGNDGKNLDSTDNFPNKRYLADGQASAWIEVGASGWSDDSSIVAPFSNYGQKNVDVFAPGVRIYSTMPRSTYGYLDGTSMAAPVVTGIAALIREYYPKLSAVQVKDIIMQSVIKRDILRGKCVSSGIVNAYTALQLAESVSKKMKKGKD